MDCVIGDEFSERVEMIEIINVKVVEQLMLERDIPRKELAARMGISESCLSRVMSGNRTGSLAFLIGLAKVFPDIDLRSFLIFNTSDKS